MVDVSKNVLVSEFRDASFELRVSSCEFRVPSSEFCAPNKSLVSVSAQPPVTKKPKTRNAKRRTRNSELFFTVACSDYRFDIPTDVKVSFNVRAQGIAGPHKIFENHIDYMLMKDLDVAK